MIDDDPISNFISTRVLKKLDIAEEVTTVNNGKEGVACLEDHCFKTKKSPQLILLDINMPIMNGYEFLERFHSLDFQNKEEVLIAILSSSSSPADKNEIHKLGVSCYIDKPLTEEKVQELLKYYRKDKSFRMIQ